MVEVVRKNVKDLEVYMDKEGEEVKKQPSFRVFQRIYSADKTSGLKEVGVVWENRSKQGVKYYSLYLGKLELLMFNNTQKK